MTIQVGHQDLIDASNLLQEVDQELDAPISFYSVMVSSLDLSEASLARIDYALGAWAAAIDGYYQSHFPAESNELASRLKRLQAQIPVELEPDQAIATELLIEAIHIRHFGLLVLTPNTQSDGESHHGLLVAAERLTNLEEDLIQHTREGAEELAHQTLERIGVAMLALIECRLSLLSD